MRNLKKFLALVLAMMMVMSLMLTVNAAEPVDFTDSDKINSTYAEAVNVLSALDIIKGDAGGSDFRPTDPITRAEVAAMLYRIAANDAGESQVKIYSDYKFFNDVTSDKWYAGAVNYCANSEYVKGVGGDNFEPWRDITGYEVLAMTLRVLGYGKNGEFEGSGWMIQTARYGRLAGLTKQIKEGTLGAPATREMVAEIMFQALQADLVDYNMLLNYYPATTLIADDAAGTNRANYKNAIDKGLLTLPLNADLMYVNYGIVGKSPTLTFDEFGRPSEMWVTDGDDTIEDTATAGEYSKFIPNYVDGAADIGTAIETDDEKYIVVTMTPDAEYHNAVTECQVAKDVTGDKKVAWKNIVEVLNGNSEAKFDGATGTEIGVDSTLTYAAGAAHKDADPDMDALHTSDKWIGATGRTTEIYDVTGYGVTDGTNVQKYVFVYVDTYLAEVVSITEAIKDPNGHVIKAAVVTAKVGTDEVKTEVSGSYEVGQLILLQSANGAKTGINVIPTGEKVPTTPTDVDVADATVFLPNGDNCVVKAAAETKRVTIKGTKGIADDKTGIETTDGDVIWASNTFLANKTAGAAKSVLPEWWDVDDDAKGITNSMINRTYDLVLDHHGYIVGMKEVLTINSTVGIITGFDQYRVGTGKYLTRVEAYMSDGTTQTFDVVDMTDAEAMKLGVAENPADATNTVIDTSAFKLFATGAAADAAWDTANGVYAAAAKGKLGIGSLVMFKQCSVGGVDAWYFADASDRAATAKLADKTGTTVTDNNMVGTALTKDTGVVKTGMALTLEHTIDVGGASTGIATQLDNKSIIFVAEPEYAYNTGNANEGDNTMKYNVHEGFKKMPTITAANDSTGSANRNILYQQLMNHPEYVLIYPQQTNLEYIIRNQSTIAVDESYLVLSRGTTYAGYSEYNVLKNGVVDVLKVSNSNDTLNDTIEDAMTAGDLLTVTGRNAAGYVISAETVTKLAHDGNAVAVANCGGVNDNTDPNPLVSGASTVVFSETDGVINFADAETTTDQALTLADNCTIQLVNLGTGTYKDISIGVAKTYINKDSSKLTNYCDFTFELDQYGYVCSLYVIEK